MYDQPDAAQICVTARTVRVHDAELADSRGSLAKEISMPSNVASMSATVDEASRQLEKCVFSEYRGTTVR